MNWSSHQSLLALIAGAALAFVVTVAAMAGYSLYILFALAGAMGVAVVVWRPFLGIWFIVLFTQLDAVANTIFRSLPISGVKLLTALTVIGVAVATYREPRKERFGPDEPALRMAFLFGVVLLISFLFVEDRTLGIWSIRRMVGLILLPFLVVRLTTSVAHVRSVLLAILVSTLVSAAFLMADWILGTHLIGTAKAAVTSAWQGMERSSGASDYNPTTAATMMLTGTACAIMLFLRTRRWRILTAVTAVAGSAGIVLSFARSSGLVFAILLVWLFFKFRRHRRFPIAVAIGLLIVTVTIPLVPTNYWERISTLTDFRQDTSLRRRLSYNIIGVYVLAEHPILGVGPGNFKHHYVDNKYRWIPGRGMLPRQLHNMYFEVATETGLLGFACFVGMLIFALKALNQVRRYGSTQEIRDLGEALHFAFVGYLLVSVFVPNEYNKYTWLLPGLAVAFARVAPLVQSGKETLRGR